MTIAAISVIAICVTAFATVIYGAATFLLWLENREDRNQRERRFQEEANNRKLNDLRIAYYEAWGYWQGQRARSGDSIVDASQAGRVFEALIRLECQLRLNGYKEQAQNFGFAIRTTSDVEKQLGEVGVAIGLVPAEYRQFTAVGLKR